MAELTRRYVVMSMASEAPFDPADPEEVFVLKPWKDPAALKALETYRDNCYPELARDLAVWIAAIASGSAAARGDVGRRNEAHLSARAAIAADAAARSRTSPRSKGKRPARSAKRRVRPATTRTAKRKKR